MKKILIANRNEVAVRIIKACISLGVKTLAICTKSDENSLFTILADQVVYLEAEPEVKVFLDAELLIRIAKQEGCDAIHPGYGFLSENSSFSKDCNENGIIFIGSNYNILSSLADKLQAKILAKRLMIPTAEFSGNLISILATKDFLSKTKFMENGVLRRPFVIKAVGGGGGKGIRIVKELKQLEESFAACKKEAYTLFNSKEIFIEEYINKCKHIEVQIIADGRNKKYIVVGDRDCTIQRQRQKLIEICPSPNLSFELQTQLYEASLNLISNLQPVGLYTVEFLVDINSNSFYFMEINPRLQVEHTVTEEVYGIDLVRTQILLHYGGSLLKILEKTYGTDNVNVNDSQFVLTNFGLTTFSHFSSNSKSSTSSRCAIQMRILAEEMKSNGQFISSTGKVESLNFPHGRGIRIETSLRKGVVIGNSFDSLIAKIIVSDSNFKSCIQNALFCLNEFTVEGLKTNVPILRQILNNEVFKNQNQMITTNFFEKNNELLLKNLNRLGYFADKPLEGVGIIKSPMDAVALQIYHPVGQNVVQGEKLALLGAMKMEYEVNADVSGLLEYVFLPHNNEVKKGDVLFKIRPSENVQDKNMARRKIDFNNYMRDDLQDVLARDIAVTDSNGASVDEIELVRKHVRTMKSELDVDELLATNKYRADRINKRNTKYKQALRTARENVMDLLDDKSFLEYGKFQLAKQQSRYSKIDLIRKTPTDGMIAGFGTANAKVLSTLTNVSIDVAKHMARCALAGTQGHGNHQKKDRMFELIHKWRMPVVFFTEGGGGRPGDDTGFDGFGLTCMAFHLFAKLKDQVPLIGIVSGWCFAGNAALLGTCDIIIAVDSVHTSIGMGGPAMIQAGGLGTFRPEEIGPIAHQAKIGVVDILVATEADAVRVAKSILLFLQCPKTNKFEFDDQRKLRAIVPERRVLAYEMVRLVSLLCDTDSVIEIKKSFGVGIHCFFGRIEGSRFGIIANNPNHLGGAIDAAACDKASSFISFCNTFKLPILSLCDTPGFMVGPESEEQGMIKRCTNFFAVGSKITVPLIFIVIRKSYGLGAQAMAGGSHRFPIFTGSWPSGEFGPMNIEGAIRLGFSKELAMKTDKKEKDHLFQKLTSKMNHKGRALSMAEQFEIDDVFDPALSRTKIIQALSVSQLSKI